MATQLQPSHERAARTETELRQVSASLTKVEELVMAEKLRAHIRVTASDDTALWAAFRERQDAFESYLNRQVQRISSGRVEIKDIEYRRGSLLVVITLIVVNYPAVKENLSSIRRDLEKLATAIQRFFTGGLGGFLGRLLFG